MGDLPAFGELQQGARSAVGDEYVRHGVSTVVR
jgi:hypothetical protein